MKKFFKQICNSLAPSFEWDCFESCEEISTPSGRKNLTPKLLPQEIEDRLLISMNYCIKSFARKKICSSSAMLISSDFMVGEEKKHRHISETNAEKIKMIFHYFFIFTNCQSYICRKTCLFFTFRCLYRTRFVCNAQTVSSRLTTRKIL